MVKRAIIPMLCCLFQLSYGQKSNFINYTVMAGLPNNSVRGIYQDSKGALYITTVAGFSIFDGFRFRNFGYKDSIRYDYVKHTADMGNGNVYLFSNIAKEAYVLQHNVFLRTLTTPNIVTQCYRYKGKNYVCTDNGIYTVENDSFIKAPLIADTSKTANAYFKYLDINDSIGIALRTTPANRFDIIDKKQRRIIFTLPGFFGYQVFMDSRKRIWLCTDYLGVQMIDEETLRDTADLFKHTPASLAGLSGMQVNNVTEDRKGNTWFATTGKGIVRLSPDGKCTYFTKDNGLLSNNVFRVFIDRDDNLWIGSEEGLQRLADTETLSYDKSYGLPGDACYEAILLDSNTVMATGTRQVSFVQLDSNRVTSFPLEFTNEGYLFRAIPVDRHTIWALSPSRVVQLHYDGKHLTFKNSEKQEMLFKDFALLNKETMLIAATDKVLCYRGNVFTTVATGIRSAKCISIDNKQRLWVGSGRGIYIYSVKENAGHYTLDTILNGKLFENVREIKSLQQDRNGNTWACTKENGIYCLTLAGHTLQIKTHINRNNGLSNNIVNGMRFINDSTIFCNTISGTDRIIIKNDTDSTPDIFNLPSLPANAYNIHYNARLNTVTFAYLGGFVIYKPVAPGNGPVTIVNSFTECYANGRQVTGLFTDSILRFANNENNLSFYFSPYRFRNTDYQFCYWLDNGGKENWQALGNQNYVQFNNLPHGNYTLYIKTVESGTNSTLSVISKKFSIKPLWHQTTLFKLGVSFLVLAIMFLITSFRAAQVRKDAGLKSKITETEIAALKAQMNPHFMFNCINSIDAFIQDNDKYNATLYLNKFARLIRNVLDSSRHNLVQLSKDIETLKLYIGLEELRHENKFSTLVNIDAALLTGDYKVPPLIIQPFVENAILHGLKNKTANDGLLKIDISRAGDHLVYTITDNGIGRTAAQKINNNKEESYGLQMSYERIKLFNRSETADVVITDLYENQAEPGTRVEVRLKIV